MLRPAEMKLMSPMTISVGLMIGTTIRRYVWHQVPPVTNDASSEIVTELQEGAFHVLYGERHTRRR